MFHNYVLIEFRRTDNANAGITWTFRKYININRIGTNVEWKQTLYYYSTPYPSLSSFSDCRCQSQYNNATSSIPAYSVCGIARAVTFSDELNMMVSQHGFPHRSCQRNYVCHSRIFNFIRKTRGKDRWMRRMSDIVYPNFEVYVYTPCS